MKIFHLFDNHLFHPDFQPLWGYSLLIEIDGLQILMDTGSNGRFLLQNMQQMGVEQNALDYVFISHWHWDHIGGLDSVLELNPNVKIVVPHTISSHLIDDLQSLNYQLIVGDKKAYKIVSNIFSTGTLPGSEPEQSLVIKRKEGLLIITGCAHPGLEQIVKTCEADFKETVYMIMGGFHLLSSSDSEIKAVANMLNEHKVERIAPSHCTGDRARKLLRQYFKGEFVKAGAGKMYHF